MKGWAGGEEERGQRASAGGEEGEPNRRKGEAEGRGKGRALWLGERVAGQR